MAHLYIKIKMEKIILNDSYLASRGFLEPNIMAQLKTYLAFAHH